VADAKKKTSGTAIAAVILGAIGATFAVGTAIVLAVPQSRTWLGKKLTS
jgi:membrane associated rhomboid family serine protease